MRGRGARPLTRTAVDLVLRTEALQYGSLRCLGRRGPLQCLRFVEELRPLALRVRGEDLVRAGHSPGPEIGAALRATLEARQDGTIDAEQELEYALRVVGKEAAR